MKKQIICNIKTILLVTFLLFSSLPAVNATSDDYILDINPNSILLGEQTNINIIVMDQCYNILSDIFVGLHGCGLSISDYNGTTNEHGQIMFKINPSTTGNISIDVGSEGNTIEQKIIVRTAQTIFVDDDQLYPDQADGSIYNPYKYIQDAVNVTLDGDEIKVMSGIYYENLIINKSITLTGENKDDTVVNGTKDYYCISIETKDVTINNFTITNPRNMGGVKRGIRIIKNSNGAKISDCIFTDNCWDGVFVQNTEYVTIENCDFINNLDGISQWDANYSLIKNCKFINDQMNIYFQRSDKNTILNCSMKSSSTIQGNVGIYLIYSNFNEIYDCSITDIGEGINLYTDSSYNTIDNCEIINSTNRGMVISGSSSNKLLNSTIASSGESGIEYFGGAVTTEYNIIDNCVIDDNNEYGVLFMPYCHYNKVIKSKISNNNVGINTRPYTLENSIYKNYIINNIEYQAYEAGNNIWNESYPQGGNYWSDYIGVDKYNGPNQDIIGSDGIGDTAHPIPGGDILDYYPLVALDEEEPEVKITKPIKGLYLFNIRLRKFLLNRLPLIIGAINIEVEASDNDTGIKNVEIYIDGELIKNIESEPYSWKWKEKTIIKHKHTIKVVAYDYNNNSATDEILVRKYL
jgi:parallel beta-helix repeat protein